MKCLIVSDSHGDTSALRAVLQGNRDAEVVFFLGDGLSDVNEVMSDFSTVAFLSVAGNCDIRIYDAPRLEKLTLEGRQIVLTHGDAFGVKSSLVGLRSLAEDTRADIIFFGHTHSPTLEVIGTSYGRAVLFNPGALKGVYPSGKTYGVIDLDPNRESIPEIRVLSKAYY